MYNNSTQFNHRLRYAELLNVDKIYILSALYGVIELDEEIEPYDVSLSSSKTTRKQGTKVLNYRERKVWAAKVIDQLKKLHNLETDEFIIFAGVKYAQYIKPHLKNSSTPLAHYNMFQLPVYLMNEIKRLKALRDKNE